VYAFGGGETAFCAAPFIPPPTGKKKATKLLVA
jgi:hypothetical protein